MSKPNELYELIQSLNSSEKRYFRIFASRHVKGEENQYMKVFDLLNKQESYDETALNQLLDRLIPHGNTSRVKTYLKDLVLKSLVAYHADATIRNRIKDLLRTVEILYHKSLGNQCLKQLEKAEKLAREHEELILLLEIITWKRRIVRINRLPEDPQTFHDQLASELEEVSRKIQNSFAYNGLSLQLYLFSMSRGQARHEEELAALEQILADPLLADPDQALSLHARYLFLSHRAFIDINRFRFQEAGRYIEDNLALMERQPEAIRETPEIYLSLLRNRVWVSRFEGEEQQTRHWIAQCQQATTKLLGSRIKMAHLNQHFSCLLTGLDAYNDLGAVEEGARSMQYFEESFRPHRDKLHDSHLLSYYHVSGVMYFIQENYSQAVRQFNEVIHSPRIELREDLHCMTRLVHLLSHLELGNMDLLPYLVKSTVRFLGKKKHLHQVEGALLGFIARDLLDTYGTRQWKPALRKLQGQLEEITASPFERKALKYFHFLAYLEARLTDQPLAETLAVHFNKENW